MRNFNNTDTYLIRAGDDMIKATVTDSGEVASNFIDDILHINRLNLDNLIVGVDIEYCPNGLHGTYGLKVGVRVVNLPVLAALKFGWPHMRQWGLERLLWECTGIELQEKQPCICLSDWSRLVLNLEQVEFAALDVIASSIVGRRLLRN
ncbi:Werner syndrome-like exonuclease [Rhynchospora pubera]|uniref:Werner syndrome-like exonuclease n=1 Tax=Rhynchospora pubera TaxID=906938 RepID=A0AAV8EN18_9POAL|nr:Werner syndrome-like exonuclease [Rhynchospora pubera]